jgi:sugar phosphate isomerase/epimerase
MKKYNGLSRRSFVKNLAGALVGTGAAAASPLGFPQVITNMGPNSRFAGVQIGTITYSYRSMPDQSAEAILGYVVDSGVNSIELMGAPAEAFAGAPQNPVGREERGLLRRARNPEMLSEQERQQATEIQAAQNAYDSEIAAWRASVSTERFELLRRMYEDAGISIYAWKPSVFGNDNSDAEISYGLRMAKALGASHSTVELPSDPALSARLGRLAQQNDAYIAYHTHQQGSMTAFDTAFSQSEHNRSNVDLGHFVAGDAGHNPIDFLHKYHDKIASAHIKDRQTVANGAGNLMWGTGDTPLVEMLRLVRDSGWNFPMTAELEYQIPEGSDAVQEVRRCVEFCRAALES